MVLTIKKQTNGTVFDEEDLSYGPGIVSKLRCRYMSLTVKEPNTKIRSTGFEFRKGMDVHNMHNTNEKNNVIMHKQALRKQNSTDMQMKPIFPQLNSTRCFSTGRGQNNTEPTKNTIVESELPPTNVVKSKLQIFEPLSLKYITSPVLNQTNARSSVNKSAILVDKEINGDIRANVSNIDRRPNETIERKKKKKMEPKPESNGKIPTLSSFEDDETIEHMTEEPMDSRLQNNTLDNNCDQSARVVRKNIDNSTIVFNFTDRYSIPDYVSFQNVSDAFSFSNTMIDVSMLDKGAATEKTRFKFLNSNIIIDGKSCLKSKNKGLKFKISFNDSLTSVFEYPSEDSYLEESEQKTF